MKQSAKETHECQTTIAPANVDCPSRIEADLRGAVLIRTTFELSRLQVLQPGTRLDQGGTYADLNRLRDGLFKALGGHEVTKGHRYIAKRGTDYEHWNRLVVEDDDPEIERPNESER